MRYLQITLQTFLLILLTTSANAETSCFNWIKQLKKKTNIVNSNGGMWGYYEKAPELRTQSVDAIQLDSRISKIFFALSHLCKTEKGIPLNDLATYSSRNLAEKGKDEFKSELLLLGKTPQQIDIWFKFYRYAQNHRSRTLEISKIQSALEQSIPLIERYVHLAESIFRNDSSEFIFNKTQTLNISIDKLLLQQPYLAQAMEEISHIPYWDINESTGGS